MRSLRLFGVVTASSLSFLLAGVYACSSSDTPPPAGTSGSSGGIDASTDRAFVPDEGGGEGGGDGGSALPLGDLPTIDEADVPCVTTNGVKTQLFPGADGGGPPVTRVQALGARRFAAGDNTPGFITFDAVGTTPKLFNVVLGTTQTLFTSEGTTIGAFAASTGKVDYQRYDDQGAPVGGLVAVGTGITPPSPNKVWAASGGGGSLVVWPDGSKLVAAGITSGGAAAGSPFTLTATAPGAKLALTYAGDKYAMVYSHTGTGNSSVASFAYATPTGIVGTPIDLFTAPGIEPVAITPTSSGFLLVVDAGGDEHVYIVPLGTNGQVSGPAHRLLGGDLPWGLASHANDAALVVLTNDVKVGNQEGPRAPQFRPLDLTGKPSGPWVCLDGKVPAGQYQDMGILADPGGGYSVVYKSVADATVLLRTDKLGSGAP